MDKFIKISYRELAYDYIKNKIWSFQFRPGDKINISSIAQALNISNTPVREALSLLESEGLVETVPFAGPRVIVFSADELYQNRIGTVSLYLGCYNMCLFLNQTAALISNYEAALHKQIELPEDAEPVLHVEYSIAVDYCFVSTLENKTLFSMGNISLNQARLDAFLDYEQGKMTKQRSVKEHQAILDALKKGDYDQIKKALLTHYYFFD